MQRSSESIGAPATSGSGRREKGVRPARTVLGPEPSAALRDELLAGIGELRSADEAADWVHKNLAAKNTLIDADADAVETGFWGRLATIEVLSFARQGEANSGPAMEGAPPVGEPFPAALHAAAAAPIILPSSPGLGRRRVATKTIRLRDKEHCKLVASQPCIVCGRTPSEAHHIRFAQPRALGRKVSDEYTVPVCRLHHRELHAYGDEASWWAGSVSIRCPSLSSCGEGRTPSSGGRPTRLGATATMVPDQDRRRAARPVRPHATDSQAILAISVVRG